MLKDSVNRFLEKNFSFEQRRKMLADRQPMSAQLWEGLASLGVLGRAVLPDATADLAAAAWIRCW